VTLIAEDLLLLLLDDESGKPQTGQLDTALGGALLVELALAGAVTVSTETKPSIWKQAKVRAEPGAEVDDVVLAEALRTIGERERGDYKCPGCGTKKLQPLMATFFTQTSRKA